MPPKIFREMEIQAVTFAASQLVTRKLPATVYKGVNFTLEVNHTNTGTATIGTADILGLINQMEVVINGQDTITSIKPIHLYYMNMFDFGIAPESNITLTSGAQSSYINFYLPYELVRGVNPADSILDARGFSTLNLQVNFSAAAFGTNAAVTSAFLKMNTEEYDVVGAAGVARHELSFLRTSMGSTGVQQIDLPTGSNNQYGRLLFFTYDSSGDLSNSIISKFDLRARSFHWHTIEDQYLQYKAAKSYGIARSNFTGVYPLPLITNGRFSERLNAMDLSELLALVTVATGSSVVETVMEKTIYA